MAWLAKLDAKAQHWPTPAVWLYLALKASLIVLGAMLVGLTALERLGIWPHLP